MNHVKYEGRCSGNPRPIVLANRQRLSSHTDTQIGLLTYTIHIANAYLATMLLLCS